MRIMSSLKENFFVLCEYNLRRSEKNKENVVIINSISKCIHCFKNDTHFKFVNIKNGFF